MRRGRALRPDYHMRQAEVCFNLAEATGDKDVAGRYALMASHFLRRFLRDDEELFGRSRNNYAAPEPISPQAPQSAEQRKRNLAVLFDQLIEALDRAQREDDDSGRN